MPGPGFYFIGEEEEREVLDVIRSGHLNRYGSEDDPKFKKKVYTLENEVARKFGAKYGLAVTSGTSALIVALQALRIGPGDEVICPGYTFIASMSSIITVGAVPVLAEIDDSLTLDPNDVERHITPKTKAIMAVHMLGNPCAMDELVAIANKHKLLLIEDTAQAFGGMYKGKYLGLFGDIGTYSFNVYKTINAGDGGLVLMNDESVFKSAFAIHDQGHMPLRTGLEVGNRSIIGQNFRMNELTGAVLLAQFKKLDQLLERLHSIKKDFKKILKDELPKLQFRKLNDEAGELATLLTVLLPSKEAADAVAKKLGTKTISHSGWHVYNNMEQILGKKQVAEGPPFRSTEFPTDVVYEKGMLPKTDDILNRAINISIGVVDAGLGSGFGVNPLSSKEEIREKAMEFVRAASFCCK
ncbi:DegT/DnrJ/EryC1/StrS family aminotransferase [Pleomorphochaeta sp. DL1XJH-081]|uniref:DegT/DnrJ/EryC1/StrS family aminotransferase n=1 Tax=Pleomorphochaeta sp. DL1XJH-081 TaxID=3409690 RepID=UPI003BB6A182